MKEVVKGSLLVSVNDTTYTYSNVLSFMDELKRLPVGGAAGLFVPKREAYSRELIIVVDPCSTALREDIVHVVVPDEWECQGNRDTQDSVGHMHKCIRVDCTARLNSYMCRELTTVAALAK